MLQTFRGLSSSSESLFEDDSSSDMNSLLLYAEPDPDFVSDAVFLGELDLDFAGLLELNNLAIKHSLLEYTV